jgi:hypothetical protein
LALDQHTVAVALDVDAAAEILQAEGGPSTTTSGTGTTIRATVHGDRAAVLRPRFAGKETSGKRGEMTATSTDAIEMIGDFSHENTTLILALRARRSLGCAL